MSDRRRGVGAAHGSSDVLEHQQFGRPLWKLLVDGTTRVMVDALLGRYGMIRVEKTGAELSTLSRLHALRGGNVIP